MNSNKMIYMPNNIHHIAQVAGTVYKVLVLACVVFPQFAVAQLFGGGIKTKKVITIPATITLAQDQMYFIASVYDQNYLPYTAPTALATTDTNVNPDGTTEAVTVNVQGSISTSGVTVQIPATTTGSGTLPAYSTTINIPAELTQDGISRDLTLSWATQSFTSSTKSITATIAAVSGTLNAKKLDINAGMGNDYLGYLLGVFTYPYNNAGSTSTYQVRDMPGIPDKMFGKYDNGNTYSYEHNFLYGPVKGEDGNTWLNNNLGADYSDLGSSSFSLLQQATSYNDYHAYGSLFQWGRKPDGHELINWTSGTAGTAKYGSTSTKSNDPTSALFITVSSGTQDWRVSQDATLWATEASTNNPCPSGFRVPTESEQTSLVTAAGITNYTVAAASKLRFSTGGYRFPPDAKVTRMGVTGNYWSSTVNSTNASYRGFGSSTTVVSAVTRAYGQSVRCIKD